MNKNLIHLLNIFKKMVIEIMIFKRMIVQMILHFQKGNKCNYVHY